MEVRKPVLELKDVPPPPPHTHSCLSVSVCSCCEASVRLQKSSSGVTGGGFPLYLSHTLTHSPPASHCAGLRPTHNGSSLCKLCQCRFPHGDPSSPPHPCSNSLQHASRCVTGAHCVQDCWRKVGGSDRSLTGCVYMHNFCFARTELVAIDESECSVYMNASDRVYVTSFKSGYMF